jgi:nucleoside-diphosphate-sugar epimerase
MSPQQRADQRAHARSRQGERRDPLLLLLVACIYPAYRQEPADVTPLAEEHAYPAEPEEGYGWEKLYAEKLCQYYTEEGKLDTRVARFHNIYGPLGTYEGGREKAPAALSRKIALVDYSVPLNLGTDRLVTIDELVGLVADTAGKTVTIRHDTSKPQGVRGRNSDNSKLREVLAWEPRITLEEGCSGPTSGSRRSCARAAGSPSRAVPRRPEQLVTAARRPAPPTAGPGRPRTGRVGSEPP